MLLRIAGAALRRSQPSDGIVASIFAALAVEALLNEITEFAEDSAHPLFRALAATLREAEAIRVSTVAKFTLAHLVLRQQAADRGARPLQDVALLMQLRDSLVHLKPFVSSATDAGFRTSRDGLLRALESRGLLSGDPSKEARSLTLWLDDPSVAAWAIDTAKAAVRFLLELLPEGKDQESFRVLYPDFLEEAAQERDEPDET